MTNMEKLREKYAAPKTSAVKKVLYELDKHCIEFIARSPFIILGTVGDVSPRGDYPGFVGVIDSKTIIIPNRSGNNRLDSYGNIIADSTLALIFLIPGINETLRVRGQGEITMDQEMLEPFKINGQIPHSGVIVHIKETYLHCGKALLRAKLWDSPKHEKNFIVRDMFADHVGRDRKEFKDYYEDAMQRTVKDEGRK
tara:strand:+ start:4310 stop:4900 length:591 start_codon:yes stop_codon:yes gene_type:complete